MSGSPVHALKFDLTRSALSSLPVLAERFRDEGAVRVSALVAARRSWPEADAVEVLRPSEENWSAIAVPSVEGTEFWLLPKSRQTEADRALGVARPSQPVGSFAADEIAGLVFKDPLHVRSVSFRVRPNEAAALGFEIGNAGADFTPAELERMRDHGSIAFRFEEKGN